jgi:hypothetical protein
MAAFMKLATADVRVAFGGLFGIFSVFSAAVLHLGGWRWAERPGQIKFAATAYPRVTGASNCVYVLTVAGPLAGPVSAAAQI